jgi:hypothetical protein
MPEFAPLLSRASFDEPFWARSVKPEALHPAYIDLVDGWSGYALRRAGMAVTPFIVSALDEAGHTNVACASGAVRFWFRPDWSSGMGPGGNTRLIELSVVGEKDAVACWSLTVSADGSVLTLTGVEGSLFQAQIDWQAGEWHSVALNYGPKGSALFVDGRLAAQGAGVSGIPPAIAALTVGSTLVGADPAQGEFDEVACFASPLTVAAAAFGHQLYAATAARGPISEAEEAALHASAALRRAEREAAAAMRTMNFGMQSSTNCVTNGPVYITNILATLTTNQGTIIQFDIEGGTNGLLYEIFTTTNLLGTNSTISITNSIWTCIATGQTCSTFIFTNEPDVRAFYVLGTPLNSDGDSLTDAYERLVIQTDPYASDTDGDGIPDGWEVLHGLHPLSNDASDDPDGDDATNYQEYLANSNPHDPWVVAWGDNSLNQCDVPAGLMDAVAISGGKSHSLALLKNMSVVAWGSTNAEANSVPTNLAGVKSIAAGANHNVAVLSNGMVTAWGINGANLDWHLTDVPPDLTNAIAVAAGRLHSLALRRDGAVTAWGYNLDGQTNVPSSVTNAMAVAAGGYHSLALRSNGTLVTWGCNTSVSVI